MIRINLIPKEERGKSRQHVDVLRMGAIGAGALTILMMLFAVFNAQMLGVYRQRLDGMSAQMAQLTALKKQLSDATNANKQIQKAIDLGKTLVAQGDNQTTQQLLERFIAVTPSDVWLTHFFLTTDKTIDASGFAADSVDLTSFLAGLQKLRGVSAVNLRSLTQKGQGLLGIRAFEISITLGGTAKK